MQCHRRTHGAISSPICMGLGRFQLSDDGKREITTRPPLLRPDRSASPDLKPGVSPARPVSPNILRPVSPNILRNAGNANAAAAATTLLIPPQRAGVSASVASLTRPLVPVASVTASAEVELSVTSSKAARRLSNPRIAAEAASRVAEAAAKAAAGGQLYGLEAVKAIARGGVLGRAPPPAQPSAPPSEAATPAAAASQAALSTATGNLSSAQADDQHTAERPAAAALLPALEMVSQADASEPAPDRASYMVPRYDPRLEDAAAQPAARPSVVQHAESLDAAELTPLLPGQHAPQPLGEPAAQARPSTLARSAAIK